MIWLITLFHPHESLLEIRTEVDKAITTQRELELRLEHVHLKLIKTYNSFNLFTNLRAQPNISRQNRQKNDSIINHLRFICRPS